MLLNCSAMQIDKMISQPQLYDRQFKYAYINAKEFSLHHTPTIIYMIILWILTAFVMSIMSFFIWCIEGITRCTGENINDIRFRKSYDNIAKSDGLLLFLPILLLYSLYTRLFTEEVHYVDVFSNIFASNLNTNVLFWTILISCIKVSSLILNNLLEREIRNEDKIDQLSIYLCLITLFGPFSFTFFYMIYYNYGNKRLYKNGNILKFEEENGLISVYVYDTALKTDKLLTTLVK